MIYLLFGVIFVSFSGPLIKICGLEGSTIAMYRILFSLIPYFFFFLHEKKKRVRTYRIKKSAALAVYLAGSIFLGFHFLFWINSFKYTTVAGSVIPLAFQPIFVAIAARIFLNEHFSKRYLVPLIMVFMSIILMISGDFTLNKSFGTGDLLSLSGTLIVSLYILLARRFLKDLGIFSFNFFCHLGAFFLLAGYNIVQKKPILIADPKDIAVLVFLGIVCSFLGYVFINKALTIFPAAKVSIALVGEPVLSIFWAFLFLGESLTVFQIFGLIIGGIGLLSVKIIKK